jgi:hypothetical protein
MTKALSMFIPLTKVDAEQRLVYGLATAEAPDRSGEICDYVTTKPHYEKWSGDVAKSTDGKSFGNLRAMHGNVAAGKLTKINFNDETKQIEICAKVVDDAEWNKVLEGVYTGFSQGGRYLKRWKDSVTGLQKFTAEPTEVSLVDLPCLPDSTFQMVKADGMAQAVNFKSVIAQPTDAEILARADELVKAAGDSGMTEAESVSKARAELMAAALAKTVLAVEEIEDDEAKVEKAAVVEVTSEDKIEPTQVWKCDCPDHNHLVKREAVTCIKDTRALAKAKAVTAPLDETMGKINDLLGLKPVLVTTPEVKKSDGKKPDLKKDLSDVVRLMAAMNSLAYVQTSLAGEAQWEADGSTVAATLMEQLKGLCETAKAAFAEEIDELFPDGDDVNDDPNRMSPDWSMGLAAGLKQGDVDLLAKSDKPKIVKLAAILATQIEPLSNDLILQLEKAVASHNALAKAGARNSSTDQARIQKVHDLAKDLGSVCGVASDAAKGVEGDELHKSATELENVQLKKTIADYEPKFAAVLTKLQNLEGAVLAPTKVQLRAVSKAEDTEDAGRTDAKMSDEQLKEQLSKMRPEDLALLMTKASLTRPVLAVKP